MNGMTPLWWLVLGVILIVIEVAAPGLVSMFFGLAALLVALLTWLIPGLPPWLAWILFAAFSVGFLLTLRRWCRPMFSARRTQVRDELGSDILGQRAVVVMRIQPGQPGKVEFRGAHWQAEAKEALEPGVQVRIVKQESIMLTVERL